MLNNLRTALAVSTIAVAVIAAVWPPSAGAAKNTECTKGGICYCVNEDLKSVIQSKIERFRQVIGEQRKMGKAVGYRSVPLTLA